MTAKRLPHGSIGNKKVSVDISELQKSTDYIKNVLLECQVLRKKNGNVKYNRSKLNGNPMVTHTGLQTLESREDGQFKDSMLMTNQSLER